MYLVVNVIVNILLASRAKRDRFYVSELQRENPLFFFFVLFLLTFIKGHFFKRGVGEVMLFG